MVTFRIWLALLLMVRGLAVEVALDLPDPLIPNVVMSGSVRITDAGSDVQSVDLPPVAGLEWRLSGPNESRTEITNGQQTSVITLGLALRAAQLGKLAIPPVTAHFADGTSQASLAATLRVDHGDAKLTGDAVAEAAFDPAVIVPGQPSKLVYRIYLRRGEVSALGLAPPEGSISLGERTIVKSRTHDAQGREWSLVTITWPLTHATPGAYTVRGQQEIQVVVGTSLFNQRVVRQQVAVAPATLTVEAMPSDGRPDDFGGLIGPLAARTSLDRERVSLGEGALLSLTVTGWQTGLVKRPQLHLAAAQVYPKDDQSGDGKRTFTWDVVPAAAGTITIPPLSFPYFDPASRSYRRADSQPLELVVIPGRSRDLGVVGQRVAETPAAVTAASPQPALPAPLRGGAPPRPSGWLAGAALVVGLATGLLAVALQRLGGLRRAPHRGRAVVSAGRDPAALAAALQALQPALVTAEQRAAAAALQAAIDGARFGGETLPDISAWLRQLEGLP